jgi:CheY-like chemotaxis protein
MTTRRGTVLIVEDDSDVRESVRTVVEEEGYGVVEAADGQQALEYLRAHERPCVVLLDLMMPVMDGWQVLAAMRRDAALGEIPVVVVSAVPQSKLGDLEKLGATALLRKPVHLTALLQTVERFC